MKKNDLVSIVFFAEAAPANIVENHIKNILSQLYSNKEIIVIYEKNRTDLEDIIDHYSFKNCKFYSVNLTTEVENLQEILKNDIKGEVIFYKTCGNIEWYPRHIDVHLDEYFRQNPSWIESLLEIKDASLQSEINTVDWRLSNPKITEIEFDEVSHIKKNLDWSTIFQGNGINRQNFIRQLGNGILAKEISVVKWIDTKTSVKNQLVTQIGQPITPADSLAENHFPSLIGNFYYKPHNDEVLKQINSVDPLSIKSIAIKRLMGMGDVIITEPIRRYLKEKYSNAEITLVTSNLKGCKEAGERLGYDHVITIPDVEVTQDALMKEFQDEVVEMNEDGDLDVITKKTYSYKDYQIKLDLDLSYESRLNIPWAISLFDMIGVNYDELTDDQKIYKIYFDQSKIEKDEKGIILFRNGSGWPGKTWPTEYFNELKPKLIDLGFNITEIENDLPYDELLTLISKNKFYIGTDSGIMHLSLALGLKAMVICGTALSQFTSLPYNQLGRLVAIHADEKDLPCLGCKHRMFFEIYNNQISFVTPCYNPQGPVCMTGIKSEAILPILTEQLV